VTGLVVVLVAVPVFCAGCLIVGWWLGGRP